VKKKRTRESTAHLIGEAHRLLSSVIGALDRQERGNGEWDFHPAHLHRIRNRLGQAAGHVAHLRNRLADQKAE